jgi:flagella basal body P-ring formation protein FlgA
MKLHRFALSVALALAALPALAGPRPVLKAEVTVATDVITLGDLVEGAGAAAATPVFRAPGLGKAGTIQAARIEEAAHAAGLGLVDTAGLAQVVVTRGARRVSRVEMETVIREALRSRYGMEQPDLSISFESDGAYVVEPDVAGAPSVTELTYDARSRRLDATLVVAGSRSTALKPFRLSGQVLDMVDVPVLTGDVERGEPVKAADTRIERRPRAEVPQNGLADPATAAGRVARIALRAGALLREQDLVRQDLVEKNSLVLVAYEAPGVSLSMRGKALEAGAMGDVINVLNVLSKRIVQATVSGRGRVTVNFATPGPMASAAPPRSTQ